MRYLRNRKLASFRALVWHRSNALVFLWSIFVLLPLICYSGDEFLSEEVEKTRDKRRVTAFPPERDEIGGSYLLAFSGQWGPTYEDKLLTKREGYFGANETAYFAGLSRPYGLRPRSSSGEESVVETRARVFLGVPYAEETSERIIIIRTETASCEGRPSPRIWGNSERLIDTERGRVIGVDRALRFFANAALNPRSENRRSFEVFGKVSLFSQYRYAAYPVYLEDPEFLDENAERIAPYWGVFHGYPINQNDATRVSLPNKHQETAQELYQQLRSRNFEGSPRKTKLTRIPALSTKCGVDRMLLIENRSSSQGIWVPFDVEVDPNRDVDLKIRLFEIRPSGYVKQIGNNGETFNVVQSDGRARI